MKRFGNLLGVGIAALIAFAILIALGVWQLQRLAWKEALVAKIEARMDAPPVEAPAEADWPTLDLASWEYRRVRATGIFDHAHEARVYVALSDAKGPLRGPGYFILTPLLRAGGDVIIVNRGFVPEAKADPAARPGSQPDGEVAVTGLLRAPEDRNAFTPADDPAKKLFFARDPGAIAKGIGLPRAAPFTIDADAASSPGGLPQGGETRVAFPNRHLEYALTWFGLAAALAGVFAAFAIGRLREEGRRR